MAQPASLDMVVGNLREFNGKYERLSETLKITSERLDTGSAQAVLGELGDIIGKSQDLSVGELKETRRDLRAIKDTIASSNRMSEKDRANILSLIDNQEKIVAENTTLAKQAAEFVQTKVKENSVDVAGVVSGALSESPALSMGVMFVANKIKEMREAARERKAERAAMIARQKRAEEIQDEEYTALRSVISNQEALEKINISQDEAAQNAVAAGVDYQEYVDSLKDQLITQSKADAQAKALEEDRIKSLDNLREQYGISLRQEETGDDTPGPITPRTPPAQEDAFDRIEEGLHEGTPYLKSILDLLTFMNDTDTGDIEEKREKKRFDRATLAETERTNELLEQLLKVEKAENNAAEEGGLFDKLKDIGGGILGGLGLDLFDGDNERRRDRRDRTRTRTPRGRFGFLRNAVGGSVVGRTFSNLRNRVGGFASRVSDGARNRFGSLRDSVRGAASRTTNAASRIAPSVSNTTRNITQNITRAPAAASSAVGNVAQAGRGVGSQVLNTGGKLLRGATRAAAPVAIALGALEGYNILTDKEMSKEEKVVAGGGLAGGAGGAAAGAAAGAIAGSVVPIIGTAIGGLVGGALGYFGGDFLGKKVAGLGLDMFSKPDVPVNEDGKIITQKTDHSDKKLVPIRPRNDQPNAQMTPRSQRMLEKKQAAWDRVFGDTHDPETGLRKDLDPADYSMSDFYESRNVEPPASRPMQLSQNNNTMKESALNTDTQTSQPSGNTAVVNAPTNVTTNRSTTAIVVPSIRNNEDALVQSQLQSQGGL